ncbi:MAG: methylase, partial [Proteobacteria bacterium]|nr:methylase [Pseudomonadota bacterium]
MSHSQTQEAARVFIERWKGRGYEKGESQQFWMDLLQNVLGVTNPVDIISFENQVKLANTSFIDAYIAPTKVLIEQKGLNVDLRKAIKQSDGSLLSPFQQAKRYAAELPVSKHPRWVVTCNFKSFLVYDMENPHGEPEEILLENLEKEYFRLRFLVEDGKAHLQRELEVSIKAGELIGKLYDAFLAQYDDKVSPEDLHSLNVLCVRLVFCLYAEDAGIFSKDQFYHYLIQYKPEQMRSALKALFTTLDTKIEERDRFLEESLSAFPYVNG